MNENPQMKSWEKRGVHAQMLLHEKLDRYRWMHPVVLTEANIRIPEFLSDEIFKIAFN